MESIQLSSTKSFLIFIILGIILTGFNCRNDAAEEVESVIRAFHQAFDHKNMDALQALCSEEMLWYTLNGKALPPQAFASFFTPMLQRWGEVRTTLKEMQFRGQGHLMTARYQSTITISSNGRVTPMQNLHTMILIKQDGAWKIWQHHMSKE